MLTSPTSTPPTAPDGYLPTDGATPDSPEEAARAFEKVLVRRFVQTMTKNMFDTGLSGEDGPSWMQGQRDQQRDMMTDVLTDHLVDTGTFGLSEMLLRDWGLAPEKSGAAPGENETTPSETPLPETRSERPLHIAMQTE